MGKLPGSGPTVQALRPLPGSHPPVMGHGDWPTRLSLVGMGLLPTEGLEGLPSLSARK